MRPAISEFSYGFALTSDLVHRPEGVTAAPVFPSLIQEGQQGGGWDVKLERPGVPLFLQFKLCDLMTRRTCRETREAGFDVPCYRMHLRSARVSRQHEMLLDLEATGQEVYYVAPMFHQPAELNDAFLTGSVCARSAWRRPSEIGPLRDLLEHHVSYAPDGSWRVFSEVGPLKMKREFVVVAESLRKRLRRRGQLDLSPENLKRLAVAIAEIAVKRSDIGERQQALAAEVVGRAAPLQRVAYYASVFLESQLFVVQDRAAV